MEFNDRRPNGKFHIFSSARGETAIHSTYGDYHAAAQALNANRRQIVGGWIGTNHDAESLVPGFSQNLHTTCEYCNKPATHIGRETGEAICQEHGKDMYESPRDSLSRLTPRTLKMYGRE